MKLIWRMQFFWRTFCLFPLCDKLHTTDSVWYYEINSICSTKGKLFIQWYVTSPNKDIADFYISIRNKGNKLLFDNALAYDKRSVEILEADLPSNFDDHVEICVQTKDSHGVIKSWFNSQCFELMKNFQSVIRKFNANYNYEYSIVSPKKKTSSRAVDMFVSSWADTAVINFKIMFCCTAFLFYLNR